MIKIKLHLGHGEMRNVWACIRQLNNGFYALMFDDGESYDLSMTFNNILKAFEGS